MAALPGESVPLRTECLENDLKREHVRSVKLAEQAFTMQGMKLGKIVTLDGDGNFLVDFPGNSRGPIAARSTSSVRAQTLAMGNPAGKEVLLAFVNNDPGLPIIIDTMYSLIDEISEPEPTVFETEDAHDVIADGKRIVFEAEDEIVLKCGKASITLTRAGKVLIKGEYVLSHSSGENRIRGGSVSVN
jgi:hypothetical protein